MTPILHLNNLSVLFPGGVQAVRGVSLVVARGSVHAIVGESGCGKSVTTRALVGLLPLAAAVQWDGLSIADALLTPGGSEISGMRGKRVGMIFQEPGKHLNPSLTIGSVLTEVLRRHLNLDRTAAREQGLHLLEMVELDSSRVFRSYPHQLSGGMKQRALIALAISCGPELLIADEPTTSLDVSVQSQILGLLDRLRRELNMAVLLVSHDIGVVQSIADHLSVMYAGRIVDSGPAAEVLARPLHPYTRLLLKAVPRASARGHSLAAIPGQVPNAARLPSGCAFHPRCPIAVDQCVSKDPVSRTVAGDRTVACHMVGDR